VNALTAPSADYVECSARVKLENTALHGVIDELTQGAAGCKRTSRSLRTHIALKLPDLDELRAR